MIKLYGTWIVHILFKKIFFGATDGTQGVGHAR
jgi:hypothetical protein